MPGFRFVRGENSLRWSTKACPKEPTGAIEIINNLTLAHASGSMKSAIAHYVKPQVLCIDELGYLLIDKFGADCLFQIISHRYERGATLIVSGWSSRIDASSAVMARRGAVTVLAAASDAATILQSDCFSV